MDLLPRVWEVDELVEVGLRAFLVGDGLCPDEAAFLFRGFTDSNGWAGDAEDRVGSSAENKILSLQVTARYLEITPIKYASQFYATNILLPTVGLLCFIYGQIRNLVEGYRIPDGHRRVWQQAINGLSASLHYWLSQLVSLI